MTEIFDNWIDGGFVPPIDGARMGTVNPYTGEQWAEVADDPTAVDLAVAAARRAFQDGPWSTMPARQRARLMRDLGVALTRDSERLAAAETRDNGKAIRETTGQVASLEPNLDYFAGVADKSMGQQIPNPLPNFVVYSERVPVGVIGAIIPWNSPMALLVWKLAPLLAAGCTVVVKPSDLTPTTALMLAELSGEVGFPPGVINVVTGGAGLQCRHDLDGRLGREELTQLGVALDLLLHLVVLVTGELVARRRTIVDEAGCKESTTGPVIQNQQRATHGHGKCSRP